ncbi:MAG: ferritin-like domain-containing protein [Myxococcales bacterium]|jgi:hypothetical protein|nr:ferritin-like domain-containing protein [Myxococcales bacterium]
MTAAALRDRAEEPLELEWLGGAPEARLRRRRPGMDDLPWGTLDVHALGEAAVLEARRVWTQGAFTEYASAAGFNLMAALFLECRAPVDLTAAAADCVVDEMDHVELVARLLMELGGAAPLVADFGALAPVTTPGERPVVRAAEVALKVSCVGEALSVPAIAHAHAAASAPLVRAVLRRLLRDEGSHARVGAWFFEWAGDRLSRGDREHLGRVARSAIDAYAPLLSPPACEACHLPPDLGGGAGGTAAHARALRAAVDERVIPGLARLGIAVPS